MRSVKRRAAWVDFRRIGHARGDQDRGDIARRSHQHALAPLVQSKRPEIAQKARTWCERMPGHLCDEFEVRTCCMLRQRILRPPSMLSRRGVSFRPGCRLSGRGCASRLHGLRPWFDCEHSLLRRNIHRPAAHNGVARYDCTACRGSHERQHTVPSAARIGEIRRSICGPCRGRGLQGEFLPYAKDHA